MAEKTQAIGIESAREALAGGSAPLSILADAVDQLLQDTVSALGEPPVSYVLLALGGYGRREMSPGSDVDLQFLVDGRASRLAPFVEACLHQWWNLGLKLGYATRTVSETVALAKDDHKTAMTLLDSRVVAGDPAVYDKLRNAVNRKLYRSRVRQLVQQILDERNERHARFGDSVYLLEPDIKLGEGGLRDLLGARWAAQLVVDNQALKKLGLSVKERHELWAAYETLLRFRNALHSIAGRPVDRLRFAYQEALAKLLGDPTVEVCMQRYWQAAAKIRASSRRALEVLAQKAGLPIGECIEAAVPNDPSTLVSLFLRSSNEDLPLSPKILVAAGDAIEQVDDAVRSDATVGAHFLEILCNPGDRALPLFRMHDIGLLSAIIPEFQCLTGLYQRNVFHVYTVDLHSLNGVAALKDLAAGSDPALPQTLTTLMAEQTPSSRQVLFLSMLLHDLCKGGAPEEAPYQVALRLGLSEEDAGCLAFLVREHLLLALLAQTRDIYNETTLRHLAREVGDRRTLALLYLLTWGDMSSANPELLTNWKSALLEELYRRTDTLLSSGLGVYADLRNVVHERRVEVLEMLLGEAPEHPSSETLEVDRFFGHLATRYFVMTQAEQVLVHMEMLRQLDTRPAVVRLDKQSDGLSLVTVICRDSPGMLARLTGVLAAHRVNIIGAEVHSRTDGSVIDVFQVERPKNWDRLAHDLARVVSGEVNPETLLRKRERPSKLGAKATPPIKTEVRVDLSASESSTVIDVIARDRPGLLYRVARALHHLGLDIQLARITTEGPSARDAFYVTWISGEKVTNKEQLERMVKNVRKAIDAPI